jgi:hypothetical protein
MNLKSEMQLLRLKECLGVSKDGEVAAALGMSKAAFSQRKNGGAIPQDKLLDLRRTRPDVDVLYILTGVRWSASAKAGGTAVLDRALERGNEEAVRSGLRAALRFEKEIADAASDAQVRELLLLLIFCTREDIREVKRVAGDLVHDMPFFFSEREPAEDFMIGATPKPEPVSKARPAKRAAPKA